MIVCLESSEILLEVYERKRVCIQRCMQLYFKTFSFRKLFAQLCKLFVHRNTETHVEEVFNFI